MAALPAEAEAGSKNRRWRLTEEGRRPATGPQPGRGRENLNETAFFFPHLISDDQGQVKMEFTMPEALTEWKFMGFAHDQELRSGYLQDKTVTAKDLMIQPNAPSLPARRRRAGVHRQRFQSIARPAKGHGPALVQRRPHRRLRRRQLGNTRTDQDFEVAAGQSRSYSWRLRVPDGMGFLTYRAVGSTGSCPTARKVTCRCSAGGSW
jgi:hypothetical protein